MKVSNYCVCIRIRTLLNDSSSFLRPGFSYLGVVWPLSPPAFGLSYLELVRLSTERSITIDWLLGYRIYY